MATFHTVWVVLETPVLIGYARISKADGSQSLDLQRDALREAGVSDDAIYEDQASGQREDRPGSVVTSKPANDGHFKTGQRGWPGTVLFYLFGTGLGKPVLVLQLRGPHLRMWP